MSGIAIRSATLADAPGLVPLLAVLGYPTESPLVAQRLGTLLGTDPTAVVLLAELAGRLVGFATLHETPVLHRATAVGRITAIAVAPGDQGSGAGRLLVAAAERHFRGRGLRRLEVTSGPAHRAAHAFYRHLGYVDQGVRFAKQLDPVEPGSTHPK